MATNFQRGDRSKPRLAEPGARRDDGHVALARRPGRRVERSKLVGAKKLKSLTPKVCKITGKGKKAKVSVLKSGKCKLTGKKGKKKVKASFRVTK